jgi:hypothetical protein
MMTSEAAGWRTPGSAMSGFGPQPNQPLFDTELGQIFLRMRNLLGISLWDMARLVGAEPTVIADLEAGSLSALPPWPELTRLVEAYAGQTGINPQPIFARLLQSQGPPPGTGAQPALAPRTITVQPAPHSHAMTNQGRSLHLAPIPDAAFMPVSEATRTVVSAVPTAARRTMPGTRQITQSPAFATTAEIVVPRRGPRNRISRGAHSTWRGIQRIMRRRVLGLICLVALPALLMLTARLFPTALYGLVSPLPSVLATPLKLGTDHLVAAFSPEHDGLTWIDIGDPRLRKSDRLPERAR